jgi:hypothetical protein
VLTLQSRLPGDEGAAAAAGKGSARRGASRHARAC